MKNIIAALDFEPSSTKVAEEAYKLSKALNGKLSIVHVVANTSYYAMEYMPVEGFTNFNLTNSLIISEEIHKHAAEFLDKIKAGFNDENVEVKVLDGEVETALGEYAAEWGADLIVMGVHNKSGIVRLLEGESSSRMVHSVQLPVLIIPE